MNFQYLRLFLVFTLLNSNALAYDDGFDKKPSLELGGGLGTGMGMGLMVSGPGGGSPVQFGQQQAVRPIDTQPAFVGANASCPFKTQSNDNTQQLIQQVRTTISNLAQECGDKMGPAVTDVQSRLSAVEQMAQMGRGIGQVTEIGQMQVTCGNYQQVLKSEFQIVSKYASEPNSLGASARYSTCTPSPYKSSSGSIEDCLRQTYMSQFSKISDSCRASGTIQQTEQLNKTLQSLTNQMVDLMNQAPQCKSKEKGMALAMKAGVQAINTVSMFSMGLGLPGLGLSLAGKLLDTIVSNFEGTDSNQKFVALLAEEDKHEDFSCLWHSLQNKMFRCGEDTQSSISPICASAQSLPVSAQQLSSLKDLRNVISKAKQAQGEEETDRSIQQLKSMLSRPIELPETGNSNPKTMKDLLVDMKNTLQNSSSKTDLKSATAIQEILRSIDSLDAIAANKALATEDKLRQIDANYSKIQDALNGSSLKLPWGEISLDGKKDQPPSKGPLDFDQTLQSYIQKKYPEQAVALQYEVGASTGAQFEELKSNLPDPNYARMMMATNIMAKRFQGQADERLDELNKRFEESLKNPNNRLATLSHADMLIKACALNSSLYYANQVDNVSTQDSLGKMNSEPTANYKKICQKFMCSNGTGIPKISLGASGDKDNWLKFKKYQCSNIDRFPAYSKQLLDNLDKKGTPCP